MRRVMVCGWVMLAFACGGDPGGDAGATEDGSSGSDADTSADDSTTTTMPSTTSASDTGSDSAVTTDDSTSVGPGTGTDGTAGVSCPAAGLEAGMHTGLTLMHDGRERQYDVYVPQGYTGDEAVPLVFDFHGYLGSSQGQAEFSQIVPAADATGTAIVLPQGVGSSFNGGACCGQAETEDIDDVGFARELLTKVQDQVCVDPDRVFAMGMSNGGYMSNRVGCEAADIFAAIGPVAGMIVIPLDECQPSRPISVMHFHGTADLIVPYGGGVYPSVAESIAVWVDRNGCTDANPAITYDEGAVTCETWSECDEGSEVTLCTVEGMGHCWPGNTDCPFGASNDDISATNALLEFFAAHPMP